MTEIEIDIKLNYLELHYLCVLWLSSRKWNAWNAIQWLQQETKWIVVNNNNPAGIL